MRILTTKELLDTWEHGLRQGNSHRALGILRALYPEQSADTLASLSIGNRDALLLQSREVLFGPRITSTALCPNCSERLEWELDIADLLLHSPQSPVDIPGSNANGDVALPYASDDGVLCVEVAGIRIRFRLPNGGDLCALSDQDKAAELREQLLKRCLIEATTAEGAPLGFHQLPEASIQGMIHEMERVDSQSNLQIKLTCPGCGHEWESAFDIVSFLWSEINNWAQHTLRTIQTLARAYCWGEAEVLAMSPTRRQIYLEMARQ